MKALPLLLALVIPQAAQAMPVRYFEFASNTQVPPARIRQLVGIYGANIMIGGDPSHEDFSRTMQAAAAAGVKRHVYLEGPGGPTGSGGVAPDELERMKRGARFAGIDTGNPGWIREWNAWGWKVWTRHQIKEIYAGFQSYEIDNLYRAIGDSAAGLVRFLKEQQAWMRSSGVRATIVLKNVEPGQWPVLVEAVRAGQLSREIFSDFHISEEDYNAAQKSRQRAYSASIGVQTLDSLNTYSYAAKGEYRVGK